MSGTLLVLSPHLDDAAFSCGGTMALLADAGWRVVMATAFTRRVHPAEGFALACQLDKGLEADVDYMALRQAEDREAARLLEADDVRWLDFAEAPHRGYESAPALFGPVLANDEVWRALAEAVAGLIEETRPDLVFGPQGLGNHVDHRQMIRALEVLAPAVPMAFYRDTPYAMRNPGATPVVSGSLLDGSEIDITQGLERKVAASCAYASQIGFQFGGAAATGEALRSFAFQEGRGRAAERFLGPRGGLARMLHNSGTGWMKGWRESEGHCCTKVPGGP